MFHVKVSCKKIWRYFLSLSAFSQVFLEIGEKGNLAPCEVWGFSTLNPVKKYGGKWLFLGKNGFSGFLGENEKSRTVWILTCLRLRRNTPLRMNYMFTYVHMFTYKRNVNHPSRSTPSLSKHSGFLSLNG